MCVLFSFSTVTIYRLDHTHSLGSVEPTIALSESLWSRIVTLIKKKEKKIYIQKDSYLYIIFILLAFHGLIDDLIMLPQYNSFWFVVAALFMGRRISKTTNNENTE